MDIVQQTTQTYDKIAYDYCKKTRQPKFLEWEENYIKKMLSLISEPNPLILDVDVGMADILFWLKGMAEELSVSISQRTC